MTGRTFLAAALLAGHLTAGAAGALQSAPAPMPIKTVKTWMFQVQNLDSKGAVRALEKSFYDLLVVEPTGTYRAAAGFDMSGLVAQLRRGKSGRLVLAYLDIAEADSHRSFWQKGWTAPEKGRKGTPDFLLKPDPDGWKDTYLVRYTDPRWQELVLSDAKKIMSAGFDGLLLDWVEAYEDPTAAAEIKGQNQDPARTMVDFISAIRKEARAANPRALTVMQNAPYLVDADERLLSLIDAVVFEGTWFQGKAESGWDDPEGGDRPNRRGEERSATDSRLKQYAKYSAAEKPVLTVDYCLKAENAKRVYEDSGRNGFIPLVSQIALDRLTGTPPASGGGEGK